MEHYAFEEVEKEELVELIKFRMQTRFGLLTAGLVTFYASRFALWHRGIGSRFFHYTRFTAIPIYALSCAYTFYGVGSRMLNEAGCYDYMIRRQRFKKHNDAAKKIV